MWAISGLYRIRLTTFFSAKTNNAVVHRRHASKSSTRSLTRFVNLACSLEFPAYSSQPHPLILGWANRRSTTTCHHACEVQREQTTTRQSNCGGFGNSIGVIGDNDGSSC